MHSITKKAGIKIIAFLLFAGSHAFAQENNPLINSGKLIETGLKLHDDKKYKEAIETYKMIDRSDTNYVDALYELSYSYYVDSQFEKSLEYARLGMKLFPQKNTQLSMQAANSLDDLKRPNEAIKLYDSALIRNPQGYLLYFNKGVLNYNSKKYEEAKKNMQQCLLINPFYSSAHYFLGNIYMFQGNMVPALLAFKTYLLVAPTGRYQTNAITTISNISKVTDDVLGYVKNKVTGKDDNFSMQQDILLSKLALDKQYKLKVDLEDNIVRQIQVVDEKLEYNKNDKGFCMQFYVPFYINTLKEGDFEAMIFSLFAGINNKKIEAWTKSNKKEKASFIDKASAYFDAIKKTQILDPVQRENSDLSFIYNNKTLIGKGRSSKDKEPHNIGKWEYYYESGALKATGDFNDNGEKEGLWIYYYENGQVKERSNTVNGVPEGLSEGWFDNGNKWYVENYVNAKLNGVQTVYYYNGRIRSMTNLKAGLKNGEQRYYNTNGELTTVENLLDDKLEGQSRSYYPNGKVKSDMLYKNDKETGTYKSYFTSGSLYLQGEFSDGQRQGLWTTYFEDGTVSEKTVYLDNEITGEFTEYFPNGKLKRKGNYYKKKIDGKLESYDDDGILFSDALYDRGKLREINFYDKAGTNLSTTTTRKGAANIIFYTADGLKSSEGFFNKEGYKEGKFISYYSSGKISEESNWKAGVKEGALSSWYPNGNIQKTTSYKEDKEDGYVKEFYANGKLRSEGWRVAGDRQQNYIFYNNVGDMISKEYYLNDDLDGYSENFEPGNIPNIEYKYTTSWLTALTQFDTTGAIISLNNFSKGNGPLIYKHFNGKNSSVGKYENYMLTGPYTYYYFDGSLFATSFYKNNKRDSIYKVYSYGGKLRTEGKFKAGEKDGNWKYYYPNGKVKEEENYVEGNLEGVDKIYLPDGSLDKILTYKNNELNGAYEIYGEKNQLAVRLNYKADIIKSYQYEEKPGVLIAPVPLKGSTGIVIAKYPNGKQSALLNFIDNSQEGERKIFYSNGNIYVDGKRLNGYNNGLVKTYYLNGNLWKEENYVLGGLHGPSKIYYPNGKPESEENYYTDDNHGINRYYDELGKLKQTLTYYYGSLLGVK